VRSVAAGDEVVYFAGDAVENQARALVRGATTPLRNRYSPNRLINPRRTKCGFECQSWRGVVDVTRKLSDKFFNHSN
jgi:hypothetical protein